MDKKRKIKYFEAAFFLFISLVAIAIPLFIPFENGREWSFIYREWIKLIPFFVIFIINNFLLAPQLLFKNKYGLYIVSCFVVIFSVAFLNNQFIRPNFHGSRYEIKYKNQASEKPQQENLENICEVLPDSGIAKIPKNRPLPPRKYSINLGVLMIGLLIIGFNSGVKIFFNWLNEQDERSDREKQYLSTELAFLRHQVSPHFFMNTLNNIHALVDIDSEKAKDSIIKLSKMMRYLLYETETERVPLRKEIEFLESYIELVRLRYDENKLSIQLDYSDNIDAVNVPSLLFLPLIENAFKHGIQNDKKSFVDIQFKINEQNLILTIKNSNFPKTITEMNRASGIGLENIRKRLNLLYKKNYILLINSDEGTFEVSLALPLN